MKRTKSWVIVVAAIVAMAILFVLMLVFFSSFKAPAGSAKSDDGPADERLGLSEIGVASYIVMDEVTGVYYAVFENDHGLAVTPLLNPDGTPSRVDDADMGDVRADIADNMQRWQEGSDGT